MLDPIATKEMKEMLPEAKDPLLNIINSSLSLGYVPKGFKLAMIKPLVKKHNSILQIYSITGQSRIYLFCQRQYLQNYVHFKKEIISARIFIQVP